MSALHDATGIRDGVNPPFTLDDFKAMYPQFAGEAVPELVLTMYLELAHHAVKEARWHSYWKMAMGLFVAHFATLWARGTADAASTAADVVSAGEARGLVASKSAGGVSISMDYGTLIGGLNDWAAWNTTQYGTQLATLAKMVGKGGMQIW